MAQSQSISPASNRGGNRVLVLVSAMAIQLCLGVAYIWSVFQTGISQSLFGGDNALAGLAYSLLLAFLTVGSVIGGKLTSRFSVRSVIIAGGIILSVGFFLSGLTPAGAPWLLWITYGVLGGVGMGFSYSTTIACAQKWFPDKKGLATGLIVASLGFGGVVFTPLVEWLIAGFGGFGKGELNTFLVLSGVFLVVCTFFGSFIKNPPEDYIERFTKPSARSQMPQAETVLSRSPKEVLKSLDFYLVAAAMMLACMGGLMMIGFAKPIAQAKGMAETAVAGVLLISVFNAAGRAFWGVVSDKIGRKRVLCVLLVGSAVLSAVVGAAQGIWIFVVIGCIGFFYGGFLSTFPAFTSDLFGPKHMATNYGMVLLGFGVAAVVSSYIAGYFKNQAAQDIARMNPAFYIAAVCAAVAVGLILLAGRKKQGKPAAENQ